MYGLGVNRDMGGKYDGDEVNTGEEVKGSLDVRKTMQF